MGLSLIKKEIKDPSIIGHPLNHETMSLPLKSATEFPNRKTLN
jgi:hypothetical protein